LEWAINLPTFFLIFVRITSFVMIVPIFSYRTIPSTYKIGFSFFLTLLAYSTVYNLKIDFDFFYLLLILKEIFVGLLLGWVVYVLFATFQTAGALLDMQIGFGLANIIDPQTGIQSPLLGNFKYILAILFFISIGGDHMLINGILSSFNLIKINSLSVSIDNTEWFYFLVTNFTQMFLIAFQIVFPIISVLFLTDIVLGIISKTIPQMNLFVIGLPLKLFLGFFILLILLPGIFYVMKSLFVDIQVSLDQLMKLLGG